MLPLVYFETNPRPFQQFSGLTVANMLPSYDPVDVFETDAAMYLWRRPTSALNELDKRSSESHVDKSGRLGQP